jgi:catechol 2,3-dioxygenase-like lactoylglutathione lyase family enzyme
MKEGLEMFGGFFQLGYATRDLDAAMALYRRRFGQIEFLAYEPGVVNGLPSPTRRIGLAYLGDTMIELIEPDPTQQTIFDAALPEQAGQIGLHHLGYLVDDHDAMLRRLSDMGCDVVLQDRIDGFLDYSYADTRCDFGYFSEFIRLDRAGRDFFAQVPRNRAS